MPSKDFSVAANQHANFMLHALSHENLIDIGTGYRYPEEKKDFLMKIVRAILRKELQDGTILGTNIGQVQDDFVRCVAKNIFGDNQARCDFLRDQDSYFCRVCKRSMQIISELLTNFKCANYNRKPRCFNKPKREGDVCDSCLKSVENDYGQNMETQFWHDENDYEEIVHIDERLAEKLHEFGMRLFRNSIRIIQRNSPASIYLGQSNKKAVHRATEHWQSGRFEGGKFYQLGVVVGRHWASFFETLLIRLHIDRLESPYVENTCWSSGGFNTDAVSSSEKVQLYIICFDTTNREQRMTEIQENPINQRENEKIKSLKLRHIGAVLDLIQFKNLTLKEDSVESFRIFDLLFSEDLVKIYYFLI